MLPLPATPRAAPGLAHFYRAPWDVVTSAYWYHNQRPLPKYEAWLTAKVWLIHHCQTAALLPQQHHLIVGARLPLQAGTLFATMIAGGVPPEALHALGLTTKKLQDLPFSQLLHDLPEEKAIQLQFWQSLPGKGVAAQGMRWAQLPMPQHPSCRCRAVCHGPPVPTPQTGARFGASSV